MRTIVTLALTATLLAATAPRANAESCTRSRQYILTDWPSSCRGSPRPTSCCSRYA